MVESEANKVCLTVTHLDGLVLARSAFHHSANYRSVLVFGIPEIVSNANEKSQLLEVMIDKMMPGRWRTLRPVTDKELAATTLLKLPLNQASAKIRTGGQMIWQKIWIIPCGRALYHSQLRLSRQSTAIATSRVSTDHRS